MITKKISLAIGSFVIMLLLIIGFEGELHAATKIYSNGFLSGAVWSNDSKSVYFAKHFAVWKPGGFGTRTLYSKLHLYRFDVLTSHIHLISSFNFESYLENLDFVESLQGDELIMFGNYNLIKVNIRTGLYLTERLNRQDFIAYLARKAGDNHTVIRDGDDSIRYLSPDRHSYIEVSDCYGREFSKEFIYFFHDANAQLKTLQELGWGRGIPKASIIADVEIFTPQFMVHENDLQPPDEMAIRKKYRLDRPTQG